jgi:hypothetical protein
MVAALPVPNSGKEEITEFRPAMKKLNRRERAEIRRGIIHRRSTHEAGHAVLMWRGGERLYGDGFYDDRAPFEEIVVNPCIHDDDGNHAPLALANGRFLDLGGVVTMRRGTFIGHARITVPMWRTMRIDGRGARAFRRDRIRQAKIEADMLILVYLAGPLVQYGEEEAQGYEWLDEYEEGNDDDLDRAYRIARDELCHTDQQVERYVWEATDRLKEMLAQDQRYWRTIHAVADTLTRRHRLSHDGAIKIMRRAWSATAASSTEGAPA